MSDQAEAGSVVAVVQPAGNLAAPAAGADNGSAASTPKSWFEGLSEGNLKIAEAKGWTKPEGGIDKVLTSYAELERQQGESLRVPAPDAPKEEWAKFHAKLPEAMRPVESADKIEFKRPEGLPADLPYNDDFANAIKPTMADAKLSPTQAQAVHDGAVKYLTDQAKAHQTAVAASVETTHDALVKDWGPVTSDGFKEKLEVANRAMKGLGLVDSFKAKGILLADGSLTDPQIAKAYHAIGEAMFKEDTLGGGVAQTADNPFKRDAKGERNLTAISALVKSDPEKAKRFAREAGENPDVWMPNNPR